MSYAIEGFYMRTAQKIKKEHQGSANPKVIETYYRLLCKSQNEAQTYLENLPDSLERQILNNSFPNSLQ